MAYSNFGHFANGTRSVAFGLILKKSPEHTINKVTRIVSIFFIGWRWQKYLGRLQCSVHGESFKLLLFKYMLQRCVIQQWNWNFVRIQTNI